MSFQAIYSVLLIDMFLLIILRSYKDVRGSGADDPIVVETRKLVISSFRIWWSFFVQHFFSLIPSRISPSTEIFDQEMDEVANIAFDIRVTSKKKLSDMSKEEKERQVAFLTQYLDTLSGEVQYLSERLSDISKTQQELLKIQSRLEQDDFVETEVHPADKKNEKAIPEHFDQEHIEKLLSYEKLMTKWLGSMT